MWVPSGSLPLSRYFPSQWSRSSHVYYKYDVGGPVGGFSSVRARV